MQKLSPRIRINEDGYIALFIIYDIDSCLYGRILRRISDFVYKLSTHIYNIHIYVWRRAFIRNVAEQDRKQIISPIKFQLTNTIFRTLGRYTHPSTLHIVTNIRLYFVFYICTSKP